METYKANRNNSDEVSEVPEKTQEEIDKEANERASQTLVKGGATAVGAYFGGSAGAEIGSKVGDAINNSKLGQAINEKGGEMIGTVAKTSPMGRQLQQGINTMNESGGFDAIDSGIDAAASGGKSATSGKMPTNLSNSSTSSSGNSPSVSSTSSSGNSPSVSSTTSKSDLSSSSSSKSFEGLMDFKLNIGLDKKIIIVASCTVIILFMMMFVALAQKDYEALALTNNTSLASSNSGGLRNCTNDEVENRLIYVGDSRIVGLESALNNTNISYIAKVSMGHSWLTNTAMGLLETELSNKTNGIVILALGTNDLHNIDKYVTTYKEIIEKYPSNKFYVLSVNPVDEAKAKSNGYSINNASIEVFNSILKTNFPDIYIDIYSSLTSFESSDGLHYSNSTNLNIHSLILSKLTDGSLLKCGSVNGGDLIAKLEELGKWYIDNVPTYTCGTSGKFSNCRIKYDNPFTTRAYGDDCTEFTSAYMDYVCGGTIAESYSGGMVDPNGSWAKSVEKCNWKAYSSDEIDQLQPGDVLIAHKGSLYSTKGHHGEVYIDENTTFGWGTIKKNYPTNNKIVKKQYGGHTHFEDGGHDYITVYRYEGVTESTESNTTASSGNVNINITKMYDSSFNHGVKPKSNQKYIMLHDTEMSQNAQTVVQSWKSSGSGVAAHFVIDRDGTIIQAVDLDTIAHHAGFGGPGNYDSKFGVGSNNRKGTGDDLVGQFSSSSWSGYTSYGMNSYSIGIEMCHVNGESYPEAQLEAVDKVIAYIDSYFGKQSTIIDHKDWRPSNSDTDKNFSTYLSNYKSKRKHN